MTLATNIHESRLDGDLHMPVGMGDIDFERLLAPILPSFDRMVVCELRGRYSVRLPDHIDGFRHMIKNLSHKDHL